MLISKNRYLKWAIIAVLITTLIVVPLLFVLEGLAVGNNPNVQHINKYLLKDLFLTTLRMIIGVSIISFLLAVPAAYLTANYQFPLRRFLLKANILPLAIPTYIMAFVYASFFSISGVLNKVLTSIFPNMDLVSKVDVLNEGWLMFFLSFALYPYIYSVALVTFSLKNKSIDEAAANLGASGWKRFFKISFPIALPAIFGGVSLVAMEVLNDYGAMSYFNVNTITAGIFQAKQMDFIGSVYLSAITFIVILSFFTGYYLIKSYRKISLLKPASTNNDLYDTGKKRKLLISFFVFLPFFFGFIIPIIELFFLASSRISVIFSSEFLRVTLNSVQLAIIPAVIIMIFSFILLYNQYLNNGFKSRFLNAIANVGYAVPGAIIAVAVMAFIFVFDNEEKTVYHFLINSLILLIFAYIIRFMAVGFNTLESGFNQVAHNLPNSARTLGANSFKTLTKVYFPMLKTTFFTGLAIVTVDILKELPMTLLLQRFNFNTLATITYEKAKVSESVQDAAPYALLLIFVGTLAVLFLVKSDRRVE